MSILEGEAVASTGAGGSRSRSEATTGDSLYKEYSGRPVLKINEYKGYRHLIVKDNAGHSIDEDKQIELLLVSSYLCEILGFRKTLNYVFEMGRQNRPHIHSIVRCLKMYDLIKATKQFREKRQLTYPTYRNIASEMSKQSRMVVEYNTIDLSSYTFEICLFVNNEHIFYNIEEYFREEQDTPHIGCLDTDFIYSRKEYLQVIKSAIKNY